MTQVIRNGQNVLLYANLAIGILVVLANGSALGVVLAGKGGALAGQAWEMGIWVAAGAVLVLTTAIGIARTGKAAMVLRVQGLCVLAMLFALGGWALFHAFFQDAGATERVVWVIGYFSLLAVYGAVLFVYAFPDAKHRPFRNIIVWAFVPLCVAIDVIAYTTLRV